MSKKAKSEAKQARRKERKPGDQRPEPKTVDLRKTDGELP